MNTIYKYGLKVTDMQLIELPVGAKIIHVGLDPQNNPCLWAEINHNAKLNWVPIFISGTGQALSLEANTHVGSFQQGPFIWHVYTL